MARMNLATLAASLQDLPDRVKAALSGAEANASKISDLTRRLDEAGVAISTLTKERDAALAKVAESDGAKAAAEKAREEATAKANDLLAKEQDIDKRASSKALEIVAAQGSPAITPAPAAAKQNAQASDVPVGPDGKPLTGLALAQAIHARAYAAK